MKHSLTLSLVTQLLIAAPLLGQQPAAAGGPEADVRAVAQAFGEALAKSDSTKALSLLHPDVLILEGSRAETKEQYRSGHLAADIRYAASVRRETLRDGVTILGESALFTRQQRSTGTSSRGAPIDRTSTEAMVLVRTPDGWRIRSIHWF